MITKCQTTSKKSQGLGINKNLNKEKETEKILKAQKEIESETQMAIEDLTTFAIEYRELINNETNNETLNIIDGYLTLNDSSFMFNETDLKTPFIITSNVTTNGSMVSINVETPDYTNGTEIDLFVNTSTPISLNYSTTPFETNDTELTEMPDYETLSTEVTQHLNESPFHNSTITGIGSVTQSSVDLNNGLNEESEKCVFEKQIQCKNIQLMCFGSGEVDCGSKARNRRNTISADTIVNRTLDDNDSSFQVSKQYLEKQPLSERIENIKCIYELISGGLMVTIVFDTPLWSVVMDSTQSNLWVGGHDSNIYETKLYGKPSNSLLKQIKPQFVGHESAVTCLAVSIDGMALISGSNDKTIKIWHINSKQCMKTITNKGPISNLLLYPFPSALFDQKPPNIVIKPFKRTIINDLYSGDPDNQYCIEIINDKCLTNSLSFMKGLDVREDISAPNKEIESETQMAIEDLTTFAIEYRELINNETNNETLNIIDGYLTLNDSSFMFNETDLKTPFIITSNVTTNGSMVSINVETPDYTNGTEIDLFVNTSTPISLNYSTTPFETNDTELTEMPDYETLSTEVTQHLNESPFHNSTITGIGSVTQSSVDLNNGLNEESEKCVFEKQILCKNIQLMCFGSGEVDCGSKARNRRNTISADTIVNRTLDDNDSSFQVSKQYLEKQPLSERIENIKCVLTAHHNSYFACNPLPTINDCNGKSDCKPMDQHNSGSEDTLPVWKVGLIAALTAIGAVCFIVVAVVAYVSYNKLKIRPELSANGYHNNPENVTRV
ncbi:unnamed protein product [Medioppia subpectinata]|uniref:Uncharacterized protein n=1 Tax=Medioppia subpectinata TaxID=1979941 RepID=A0A7R9KKN0_9ACAR|nr:unnamed protein product [Medioppia subpectinata]CAG2104150.1 unnamed protein product [Medioppia subpectinata]